MSENKIITLPSGAELSIGLSPFAVAKDLFQAVAEEMKGLKLDMQADVDGNFFKDLFCTGLSSRKIEKCIMKCLEKCLYNKQRINDETFETMGGREDYLTVLLEVAKENLAPFTKSLYAQYGHLFQKTELNRP